MFTLTLKGDSYQVQARPDMMSDSTVPAWMLRGVLDGKIHKLGPGDQGWHDQPIKDSGGGDGASFVVRTSMGWLVAPPGSWIVHHQGDYLVVQDAMQHFSSFVVEECAR